MNLKELDLPRQPCSHFGVSQSSFTNLIFAFEISNRYFSSKFLILRSKSLKKDRNKSLIILMLYFLCVSYKKYCFLFEIRNSWETLQNMILLYDKIVLNGAVLLSSNILFCTSLIQVFADVLHHNKKPIIALIFTLCLFANIINIHVLIWTSLTQQTCQTQYSLSKALK